MDTAYPIVDFDRMPPGAAPDGWTSGLTGRGEPRWTVEPDDSAPSKPHVLARVASGTWHLLRVEFSDRRIRVILDGRACIDMDDSRIAGPGAVGVWTKADSVTSFDDFRCGGTR